MLQAGVIYCIYQSNIRSHEQDREHRRTGSCINRPSAVDQQVLLPSSMEEGQGSDPANAYACTYLEVPLNTHVVKVKHGQTCLPMGRICSYLLAQRGWRTRSYLCRCTHFPSTPCPPFRLSVRVCLHVSQTSEAGLGQLTQVQAAGL